MTAEADQARVKELEELCERVASKRDAWERSSEELEHAIQGSNAVHMARVKELERERDTARVACEEGAEIVTELRTRIGELEHSLADAMEQIEAIQGSNAVHMARVAELEGKLAHEQEHFRRRQNTWSDLRDELKECLAELEAAQTPRPMSEAPRDGTKILVAIQTHWEDGGWPLYDDFSFDERVFEGWFPDMEEYRKQLACPPCAKEKS